MRQEVKNYLVSICVPTYNGSEFLNETLNSIKAQTYSNIEVIISDDNSKDDTLKIVEDFKNKVDFPVYIYRHTPSGIGANWNNCICKSNGYFIKFLFQDDLLFSDAISEMVKIFNYDKECALVSCKRNILIEEIDKKSGNEWIKTYGDLQKKLKHKSEGKFILNKKYLNQINFAKEPLNIIGEPTCTLIKKSIFYKIGYFDEELEQILDFEFYCRVLKKYKIIILDKTLVAFRIHANQTTQRNVCRKIIDHEKFPRILYSDFFWHLNSKEQRKLLNKFSTIYKKYVFVRNFFRKL